jgi:DNA-binding NtrC family response regulator
MSPGRILVVDDERSVTNALYLILADLGHRVDAAKSTAEATALLEGSPYDLVFTDLRLPDGSGIDLLTQTGLAELRELQKKYKFETRHTASQLMAFAAAKISRRR